MREAIGGTLLFWFIIPIFMLIIMFVGFIINYASAYRSANYLVEQIETCQSMSSCTHTSFDSMKSVIREKYKYGGKVDCSCNGTSSGTVCGVTLYVGMDLPLIGRIDYFKVNAETKAMYQASGALMCP